MPGTRKHKRVIKRLETEFSSEGLFFRGISSDLSEKGLFVRTSKPFSQGSTIDLVLHLPNNTLSRLKGVVRWAAKMGIISERDGMGIEIIQSDQNFIKFLNTLLPSGEKAQFKESGNARPVIALPAEDRPATPQKNQPAARPKNERDTESDEIDSALSSIFSKRDKK